VRSAKLPLTLALVVVAVILQTTLFGEGRLQPLGASPALVTLVVIATVRYLEPEQGLLVSFTAGLLMDLLGSSPLGLWAIAMTTVGYVTLRIRRQADRGMILVAVGVFGLAFMGNALFSIAGTLFGQRTLTDPDVLRLMVLPALYTMILAAGVLPGTTRLVLRGREPGWNL
jgi:rod shape-determining protein MreD